MSKKSKAVEGEIEKTYQKKTQLEHILLRPDTYIGTVEHITEKLGVIDEKTGSMINKEITYVPDYAQRKKYLLAKLNFNLEKNQNKKKFLNYLLHGELSFKRTKNKKEVYELLKSKQLASLNELKQKYKDAFKVKSTEIITSNNIDPNDDINSNNNTNDNPLDYDYLVNMNIELNK